MTTELRTAEVDLGGLMSVFAGHLYSTPQVAVRELVQNAHDSIVRRRLEDPGATCGAVRLRGIRTADAAVVSVEDDGAGLTEPEIHAYLATVGTGYTRMLRELTDSDELIGAFGLGFLSAFSVADRVTVTSVSHREPGAAHRYVSEGGERYSVEPLAVGGRSAGTTVELLLKTPHAFLADEEALRELLTRYCALLTVPVYVGDDSEPVNAVVPPWRRDAPPTEDERLQFAARFSRRFEPLCTMPVAPDPQEADATASDAVGMLWVQDGGTYGTSDNRELAVFLRGMLLDDDARDLLPPWAGFIGGVVESARLTPTASREALQRDERYEAVRTALTEAIVNGLYEVARLHPAAWRRVLSRHGQDLLGAALCDERLFALLVDDVPVPTSRGDLTAGALRATGDGTVHVALGSAGGFEEMLYRALQVPVARGDRYAVLPFLRRYAAERGCTLVEIGTEEGNRHLFRPESLPVDEVAWLSAELGGDGEQVVPARFAPADLPLVLVPDREVERKRLIEADEADARIPATALRLARAFTARTDDDAAAARLYVNLDSPPVQALLDAYRTGHAGTATAAGLLRSAKVIMSAAGSQGAAAGDFGGALRDFGAAVTALLDTSHTNRNDTAGERA